MSKHWDDAARALKEYPGQWVPVHADGFLKDSYLRSIPTKVKAGKLAALREGFAAKVEAGVLHLRFVGAMA